MRFLEGTDPVPVRWFRAEQGALVLEGPSPFRSSSWKSECRWEGIGDQKPWKGWANGDNPVGYLGVKLCHPIRIFRDGPLSSDVWSQTDDKGSLDCCGAGGMISTGGATVPAHPFDGALWITPKVVIPTSCYPPGLADPLYLLMENASGGTECSELHGRELEMQWSIPIQKWFSQWGGGGAQPGGGTITFECVPGSFPLFINRWLLSVTLNGSSFSAHFDPETEEFSPEVLIAFLNRNIPNVSGYCEDSPAGINFFLQETPFTV